MNSLKNREEFENIVLTQEGISFVLFYTETSDKSQLVLNVMRELEKDYSILPIFLVNATFVRDIHPIYGINSVPAVLVLNNGKLLNIVYGLQSKEYYEDLLSENIKISNSSQNKRKGNRVIIYTSDGCPWCNRVKSYLKGLNIPFREINVSKKPHEADRLVKRTGQMGTPQIDINGTFVVGFDKARIDQLLGIKSD